ncbi:MAG: DUF1861 family protein [Clostridia bacterium]|nr:DUF1861 family protein [Clostridia bacterium]
MSEFLSKSEYLNGLLIAHREKKTVVKTYKLSFFGVDGQDVYNICNEFTVGGKTYIAGRVEKRNSEISEVVVFEKIETGKYSATDIRFEMLQDPCCAFIDGEMILGGTKIYADFDGRINNWNTAFFRGKDLNDLTHFADAPKKMKDVRLFKTDKVHIFTRPQGGKANMGKIGYAAVDSLSDVNEAVMENAVLLDGQFDEFTWGGVNQVHLLSNGKLGVLGHIAVMSEGDVRHYYAMTFLFDQKTGTCGKVKIICERSDFTKGTYKREDLIDVVFTGGLNRKKDGTAELFVGLSDAEAHCAVIEDPFKEYETDQ